MDRRTSITKPDFFYLLPRAGQTSPIPHTTFVSKQNEAKRSVDGETWAWFLKTLLLSLCTYMEGGILFLYGVYQLDTI